MDKKIRNGYYRRLLLDEISNKRNLWKLLNKQLGNETNILNDSTTWIKKTHNKKFDSLYKKKQQEDGIKENPNNTIWNLTSQTFSNDEYQVLSYGLNHGWQHIKKRHSCKFRIDLGSNYLLKKVCKETNNHVERAKTSLRAMAFSLIDLENKQISKDKKKLDIKNLRIE